MKKILKVVVGILGIIVVLGIVFFTVDYNRVKNQKKPIFCIKDPAGVILDGGTIEYLGLGYKVIDFHTIAGFDDIKIGTWFMDYNDFEEEIKAYEKKFEESLSTNEENNSDLENVIMKVDSITIKPTSISIIIINNNDNEIGYDEKNDKEIIETVKLKVLATTEDLLPGQLSSSYMGLDFITYDEVGQKLGFNINKGRMYISTNKEENTRKAIKEIAEKYGYTVNDEIEYARKNEQSMMAMKVFVYGFVSVISLVSITNIVNTISTNINLRKREFAIIKSIGVTPSGFNKMIYLESLLYGALSLIYGIPIGMGITILMNKTLGDVINLGMVIPWNAIIISFVGIFIITFIASYIPMKKINKENIIDSIRQESI